MSPRDTRRIHPALAALCTCGAAAGIAVCASGAPPEAVRDRTLGNLPATFAGLRECAGGGGTHWRIDLLPAGGFMLRVSRLHAGREESRDQLGTWFVSRDGRTLILQHGSEIPALAGSGDRDRVAYWAVADTQTLRMLDPRGGGVNAKPPCELKRAIAARPIEPRVELWGMFRSTGDGARFHDCGSEFRWPVAPGGAYAALERAAAARKEAPGSELLVHVAGRIEVGARGERGDAGPALVVEKLLRALPGESCGEHRAWVELPRTRWRPVLIGGKGVSAPGPEHEPWIVLDPRAMRVTGSGGCNRFTGSYDTDDDDLSFGTLTATRRACGTMDTEAGFLRALKATRRYQLFGRILELMDDDRNVLMRLEESNPR